MIEIDKAVKTIIDFFLKGKKNIAEEDIPPVFENKDQFHRLINELNSDDSMENLLQEYGALKRASQKRKSKVYRKIQEKISPPKFRKLNPYIYLSAAVLLVFFSLGIVFYRSYSSMEELSMDAAKEILPGRSMATIVMDDGTVVSLDSSSQGIVVEGSLRYSDGSPVDNSGKTLGSNRYMTLEVPRGGQYNVHLPDGTSVFMNAESSLRYPLRFDGAKREVFLKGEAFFDVVKDAKHPFVVHSLQNSIQVLGTSFNVKAYENEAMQYVTLVHGAVKVSGANQQLHTLKPGQQSVMGKANFVHEVEVSDFTRWKEGEFTFNDESLQHAMEELGRWYDLDIHVTPSASGLKLWGSIGRYDSFDKVLEILKIIDKDLKVKIHNRRVEIMK